MVYTTKIDTIYSLKNPFIFRFALKMPTYYLRSSRFRCRMPFLRPEAVRRYREMAKKGIEK